MSFEMAVPRAPDVAWPRAGRAGPIALGLVACSCVRWYSEKASCAR